jgi:hypothetical protein
LPTPAESKKAVFLLVPVGAESWSPFSIKENGSLRISPTPSSRKTAQGVDSIDSISRHPLFPNPYAPFFHAPQTQEGPAPGRAFLELENTVRLLVTAVVMPSMMADCGVRGDNRAGHNRKRNSSKQEIAEHFHNRTLFQTQPPNLPGGPGNATSLHL